MWILRFAFILAVGLFSSVHAQTTPTDPGNDLLRSLKTVADSNQIDNPAIVGWLFHLTFTPTNVHRTPSAGCASIRIEYHVLSPSIGASNHRSKQSANGLKFLYKTDSTIGCPPRPIYRPYPERPLIEIDDIPSYGCITTAQINHVFNAALGWNSKIKRQSQYYRAPVTPPANWINASAPPGFDFLYDSAFSIGDPGVSRIVFLAFWMTKTGSVLASPALHSGCLLRAQIVTQYTFNPTAGGGY